MAADITDVPRSAGQSSAAWQRAEGGSEMAEFAAAVVEPLDEAECLQLISAGGIGRIGYTGRYGPTVLPVNFVLYEQAVVFRTGQDSPIGEDLRTGIADADYVVAFEVDEISQATREGWSILIQGSAQHVDSDHERAHVMQSGVEAWPDGEKDLFIRIPPTRITGRRIRRPRSWTFVIPVSAAPWPSGPGPETLLTPTCSRARAGDQKLVRYEIAWPAAPARLLALECAAWQAES